MKRRQASILLCLAVLGAAAGGCAVADTGSFVRLQEEMEDVKRQVAAVRAAPPRAASAASVTPAGRINSDELTAVRKTAADAAADTDRLKSDLLATSTRLDETKVAMQKEVSRLNGTTADLGQSLQDVKVRLARLDEIERRIAALEEKVGRLAAAQPHPGAPPAGAAEWKSPEEMYDYALGLIKGGDTRKGREVLNAFAAKYPNHRLMQNVYYWKGETFYSEKDFENAILSFQDVIDRYPGGDKAPDSMLKQGLSFQALKDKKNARIVLELILTKYPKSPAAEKARQKLAELK